MNEQQTTFHSSMNFHVGKEKRGIGFGFWFGLLLIFVGGGLLLDAFNIVEFGEVFWTWWPSLLMIIAVAQLVSRSGSVFGSGILFTVGALLQLRNLGYLEDGFWSAFWPILIIMLGLSLVTSRWKKKESYVDPNFIGTVNVEGSRIDRTAIFTGIDARVNSQDFSGGDLTAVFGGIELDLRNAQMSGNVATLAMTVIFGGVELHVPQGWRIVTKGTPIFGGIDDKSMQMPLDSNSPTLIIDATIVFGGLEIH